MKPPRIRGDLGGDRIRPPAKMEEENNYGEVCDTK